MVGKATVTTVASERNVMSRFLRVIVNSVPDDGGPSKKCPASSLIAGR